MEDSMRCPRRDENPVSDERFPPPDHWTPTCSYCGSLKPEDAFKRIEAGEEVVPTDKSYKAYVGSQDKLYFQHFSAEDKARFIELVNSGRMKIGVPGYFYRPPFFAKNVRDIPPE